MTNQDPFWERDENRIPKGKLDTLSPLQESCHDAVPACVAETDSLYVDRSMKARPASISSRHVRKLIEVCCDEDSNMGIKFVESQGCRHVRITVKDDFVKQETVEKVINEVEDEASQSSDQLRWSAKRPLADNRCRHRAHWSQWAHQYECGENLR